MAADFGLPAAIESHPRLGQWLDVQPDGKVRAFSGKVDLGQGISHALRLIVAQALALPAERIVMVPASTRHSPDEAVTSGSLSVQHSGAALRLAAICLRERCRAAMARRHAVADDSVTLRDGVFSVSGVGAGYAELADAAMLASPIEIGPDATIHPHDSAGASGPRPDPHPDLRPDIAAKVFGEFEYINDRQLPGMLHGRVFRPDTLTAAVEEAGATRLLQSLRTLDDVTLVVRDGLLFGVLATSEAAIECAARSVEKIAVADGVWRSSVQLPAGEATAAWLKAQPVETGIVLDRPAAPSSVPAGDPPCRYHAAYHRPWLQHASIGLCCAIAQWHGADANDRTLDVQSHSQGIFNLRRDLALAFEVAPERVSVSHVEAAGCYGHNGADDVAFDAAWLAQQVPGHPVRVQWSRHAEMGHAPLAPAMRVEVTAELDAQGHIASWSQQVWSQGHGTRPGRGATPALLGAWQTATPAPIPLAVNAALAVGGGAERNAVPPYEIAAVQVLNHRVLTMPLRVSALRSLGAHVNVFAAESLMDEIACDRGIDPLAFRLRHLQGAQAERAVAVLEEVARCSDWAVWYAADRVEGEGRGLAFARYKNTGAWCAVVAEVAVQRSVQLRRLWIAADIGRVVHPDGARNQLEGGAVQAASWTLCEAAQLSEQGVRSTDWVSYPILGFREVPTVHVQLLDRPDCPSLGAGECAAGPTAAAIANAVFAATGVRVRSMPFTADNLMHWAQQQPA